MSGQICVVGLGLMGGSLALALRGFRDWDLWGIDRDEATRAAAIEAGAVERALPPEEAETALAQSDLTILCLYPQAALEFLRRHGKHCKPGSVVTDLVGIKTPVVDAARQCLPPQVRFVGGHPMAGREKSGFSAATATLFQNCNYILTRTEDTDPEAYALVEEMARYAGAGRITHTDPAHHDRMIAYTSQMAHVLAAAIVRHPTLMESPGFDGGSFADLTRVATLNEEMWSQLFLLNREPLCEILRGLEEQLAGLRALVEQGDQKALREALAQSTGRKAQWEIAAAEKRRTSFP